MRFLNRVSIKIHQRKLLFQHSHYTNDFLQLGLSTVVYCRIQRQVRCAILKDNHY